MLDIYLSSLTLFFALFFAFRDYRNLQPSWLKLVGWIMLLKFLFLIISYSYWRVTNESNHFIYNLYTMPSFLLYFSLFYIVFQQIKLKIITVILSFLFLLTCVYHTFILDHFYHLDGLSINVGQLFLLALGFTYVGNLLQDQHVVNYFRLPFFWIASGIMFYCVSNFVYMSLFELIINNNMDPEGNIYFLIVALSSNVQFGFFAIAFICKNLWIKAS